MAPTEHSLVAGVAVGDLNPALGVQLGGYPYCDRPTSGIHDPIMAAALYLATPGGAVMIIATDLFWITRAQADRIRRGIAAATGLRADQIQVTCSHTHSAPWMSSIFDPFPGQPPFETRVDQAYIEQVIATCTDLGREAVAGAFPAEVGLGLARCGAEDGIGGNRRDPVGGVVDADLPLLAVRDRNGTIRALWTKYALHPTVLNADNTLASADFPGPLRQAVAEHLPEAAFLYSMGTAGDQSPRYFRSGHTFAEAERFGRTLAAAVLAGLSTLEWHDAPVIATADLAVDLPVKSYPEPALVAERVAALRARHADLVAAGAGAAEIQTAALWLLGAECDHRNALLQTSGGIAERYRQGTPYTVSCLRVGEWAWAFLPGEVFCEFGLEIREQSPFEETFVVTLTNGDLPGYCVTAEALAEGGYEPGNSILAADAGPTLVGAALDLLMALRKEGA